MKQTECRHPTIATTLRPSIAGRNDSEDGVIIDVRCQACGCEGSFSVEPYEVQWDPDPEEEA